LDKARGEKSLTGVLGRASKSGTEGGGKISCKGQTINSRERLLSRKGFQKLVGKPTTLEETLGVEAEKKDLKLTACRRGPP